MANRQTQYLRKFGLSTFVNKGARVPRDGDKPRDPVGTCIGMKVHNSKKFNKAFNL